MRKLSLLSVIGLLLVACSVARAQTCDCSGYTACLDALSKTDENTQADLFIACLQATIDAGELENVNAQDISDLKDLLYLKLFNRGFIYFSNLYPRLALQNLDRIQETGGRTVPPEMVLSLKALTLSQMARYRESIDKAQAAIDANPEFTIALVVMGLARHMLNEPDAALAAFRKAIEQAGNNAQDRSARNFAECGILTTLLGLGESPELAHAIDQYTDSCIEALNDDYNDSAFLRECYYIFQDYYRDNGKLPDAREFFNEASVAYADDDFETAATLFCVSETLDPLNPVFEYNLALSLALNDNRVAVANYYRYLYLAPDADDADEVRQILDDLQESVPSQKLVNNSW